MRQSFENMERDPYFGEEVIWTGRPKLVSVPLNYRVGACACGAIALITTLSALVVATALHAPVGSLLLFAAWMATLSLGFWRFPRWWRSELEYTITDRNIIVRRGKLRRFIDSRTISFARIHWHPSRNGIGDLELVRAVPSGALRRRLSITLTDIVAPDRVWAFVRGVTPSAPAGSGNRLLAQRLDDGERVLWSQNPVEGWRKWLPDNVRAAASLFLGLVLTLAAVNASVHAIHAVKSVLEAGLDPESLSFVALVVSITLSIAFLGTVAVAAIYWSVVRPARLEKHTRYLITDRRVLIQRGADELHLDRARIVDVIDAPSDRGRRSHLFLVLDGPRAAAFAPSGAFGEAAMSGLLPILRCVEDAEVVQRILRNRSGDLPLAA